MNIGLISILISLLVFVLFTREIIRNKNLSKKLDEQKTADRNSNLTEMVSKFKELTLTESEFVSVEMDRIQSIISDAAQKLNQSFQSVATLTEKQVEQIDTLTKHQTESKEEIDRLRQQSSTILKELNQSIQNLQFEDLARQVSEQVGYSQQTLQNQIRSMNTNGDKDGVDISKTIEKITIILSEQRARERVVLEQENMEKKSVELF